jgi:hypothetical protein
MYINQILIKFTTKHLLNLPLFIDLITITSFLSGIKDI